MCDDIIKISNDNTFELAMPIYIILHEGGHALIASLYGAKIIEFNIMEGYIIAPGGVFSEITLALFYAAGMLTPVSIFTIYLMRYQRGTGKGFYRIFSNEHLYLGYMEEKNISKWL